MQAGRNQHVKNIEPPSSSSIGREVSSGIPHMHAPSEGHKDQLQAIGVLPMEKKRKATDPTGVIDLTSEDQEESLEDGPDDEEKIRQLQVSLI